MKKFQEVTPRQWRSRSLLSFALFTGLFALGFLGWRTLYSQPNTAGGTRPLLRRIFDAESKASVNLFSQGKEAKTFPLSAAVKNVRVNGDAGMDGILDTTTWRLFIARAPGDTLTLQLSDIKALPKTEVIFDFKCIEGWDQVTHWGGVKWSDFVKHYHLDAAQQKAYTGLKTPDGEYYVGIDKESMMHPQTLLCYEMNGEPLPQNQGYPLRLIIPVKYGIKHLKRIGTIHFSDDRPADFWAEKGYDYGSGH